MKYTNILKLLLLSQLFLTPAQGYADVEGGLFDSALPSYDSGDIYVFSNRRVEWLKSVENDHIVWTTRSGKEFIRDRNFVIPILKWRAGKRKGQRRIYGNPDHLWPLKIGNDARFRVVTEKTSLKNENSKRSVQHWQCEVKGYDALTIKAGTFSSYSIVCDRYSPTSMTLLQRKTWHYAPSLGHYIKHETQNYFTGKKESFELAVTLSGRQANVRRLKQILSNLDKN